MRLVNFLSIAALGACMLLAACDGSPSGPASGSAPVATADGLAPVDTNAWREVGTNEKRSFDLWSACASGEEGFEAADPSLKGRVTVSMTTSEQVSRRGKLQAQCIWTGPDNRQGRIVVDVLCWNNDNDRCSRFAYATEGDRRITPVPIHHEPPPPMSTTYPPGRDDVERGRSQEILSWARDHGPGQIGALRAEFRAAKIGIDAEAKIPVLCGQVREAGRAWRRFAVFSLGAAANPPSPTFNWLTAPRGVSDFCDVRKEGLQWYAIPDSAMNGG